MGPDTQDGVYATPRVVTDIGECGFYQAYDLPGIGHVPGNVDLRAQEHRYTGHVPFAGKRVLEVGTANGYLAFWMERQGAEVVSVDLCEGLPWDVVPYAGFRRQAELEAWRAGIIRINNGYWFCHRLLESSARMVYAPVYRIPRAIGPVDICTFCSTLLHFENPFRALHAAAGLTRETMIVTDVVWNRFLPRLLLDAVLAPAPVFIPRQDADQRWDTWWFLSPALVRRFLSVLGFEDSRVRWFLYRGQGRPRLAYSVVARRTADPPEPLPAPHG